MTEATKKLHQIFKKYGGLSLQFRQKCIGMLPGIFKQKISEQLGMSIFEYAAKFAGISNEQVRVTLRLEKKFEDKPILKKLLNEGEVSISKLARIASIATTENEEELAEHVKLLPKSAVETLVKDIKLSGCDLQPRYCLAGAKLRTSGQKLKENSMTTCQISILRRPQFFGEGF
jgi:predicted HTH domain antitoxin